MNWGTFSTGVIATILFSLPAAAQDQQIGARTKAMGGSYTAFEDDPVSVWLNPAGIATQQDQFGLSYQTYTGYQVKKSPGINNTIDYQNDAESILIDGYQRHLERYQANRAAAVELVNQGESPRDETLDVAELASYTLVANLILNFDGTITKE